MMVGDATNRFRVAHRPQPALGLAATEHVLAVLRGGHAPLVEVAHDGCRALAFQQLGEDRPDDRGQSVLVGNEAPVACLVLFRCVPGRCGTGSVLPGADVVLRRAGVPRGDHVQLHLRERGDDRRHGLPYGAGQVELGLGR